MGASDSARRRLLSRRLLPRRLLPRRLPLALPAHALVVPAIAGVGAAVFLVTKPGVARSMAGSPRALGFSIVVAGIVLGLGWLLPRLGRGPIVTVGAQLVPVVLAFVATVLPALNNVTVDEAFPVAVPTASATSGAAAPGVAKPASRPDVAGQAALHGIDHSATGRAILARLADGSYVVRLASLDVEPGPDYQVHVVPGAGRDDPGGGTHLGRLRGNKGNLNYAVPGDTSVRRPLTVLIWCRAFAVPIAAATIR